MLSFKTKLLLLGVVLIGASGYEVYMDRHFGALAEDGIAVPATITRLTHDRNWLRARRSGSHVAHVTFRTADGRSVRSVVRISGDQQWTLRVGGRTTVTYLPSAPEIAEIGTYPKGAGSSLRWTMIGIFFLSGAGVLLGASSIRSRSAQYAADT